MAINEFRTFETDVLVIGGGGAGARAAIESAKQGVNVILVDKGPIGKMGLTPCAGGGFERKIDVEQWFRENVQKGCYICDQNLVEIRFNENAETVREFEGVEGRAGFGVAMINVLRNEISRRPNINVLENVMVTKLLANKGKIAGATGLDLVDGEFIAVKAKAVVLATGGYGNLYWPAEDTPLGFETGVSGDGHALAYHVGADLVNMEMVQFSWIPMNPKRVFCCRHFENIRPVALEGPYLDKDGNVLITSEEVKNTPCGMDGPDEYSEIVMRRVGEYMRKGVDCYLKNIAIKPDQRHAFPEVDAWLGLESSELDKVRFIPGCLTTMGGPKVNEKCETNVSGLYATGETIGNIHGSYRMSQMLNLIITFGRRAGMYAAEYAKKNKQSPIDEKEVTEENRRVYGFLHPKQKGVSPVDVKKKILDVAMKHLYVTRNGEELKEAIKEIERMRNEDLPRIQTSDIRRFNLEWRDCLDVPVMLDVAEMVARSALFRNESRGCHYREDFPKMDNKNWLYHTLLKSVNGEMSLSKESVIFTKMQPPK